MSSARKFSGSALSVEDYPLLTTRVQVKVTHSSSRLQFGIRWAELTIISRTVIGSRKTMIGEGPISKRWLALVRVLPFAEGAPFGRLILILRSDGVDRYSQALAYRCPVLHPHLL